MVLNIMNRHDKNLSKEEEENDMEFLDFNIKIDNNHNVIYKNEDNKIMSSRYVETISNKSYSWFYLRSPSGLQINTVFDLVAKNKKGKNGILTDR